MSPRQVAEKKDRTRISAEELFTDRVEPQAAFWKKYDEMVSSPGGFDIIHYYGLGGIGKTTLLKKIYADLVNEKGDPNVILYSFETTGNRDKASFLYTLARQIGLRIKDADFTVFIYAYYKYLEGSKLTREEINARLKSINSGMVAISGKVAEAMRGLISVASGLVPLVGNTLDYIGNKAVDSIENDEIEILTSLVKKKKGGSDQDIKNKISRIDYLSAGDISELEKELEDFFVYDCRKNLERARSPFVIMLDGYEFMDDTSLNDNSGARRDLWLGGTEHNPGVVSQLPNVLWVISGRERVRWGESVIPGGDTHLLGSLSEADSRSYFLQARDPGDRPMSEDLINGLFDLTKGTPVFMDMCFDMFERGEATKIGEFGMDAEELAARYLRGLGYEAQKALEFLCALTRTWTDEMVEYVYTHIESDEAYDIYVRTHLKRIKEHTYVEQIGDSYKMHDIFRSAIRKVMDPDEIKRISETALQYLTGILNDADKGADIRGDALLALDENIDDYSEVSREVCESISNNSKVLYDTGRLLDRVRIMNRLYEGYKAKLGENDILTLAALGNLANAYSNAGDYNKALAIYEQVYEARKLVLGEDHLHTALAMSNMAAILIELGEITKALELESKAYVAYKRMLGEEHPKTLSTMNDMAVLCSFLGEYQTMQELSENVYEAQKRLLGEDHPDTLSTMLTLAAAYNKLGDPQKSLELEEKVYEARRKILGEEHPDTLLAMNNLATSYSDIGEIEKALKIREQAYDAYKRVLGEEHPDTLSILGNLANSYSDIGEYGKALEIEKKVYEARKRILGEEHPKTLSALENLGISYSDLGENQKALELLERAFKTRKRVLGKEHPDTLEAMFNLLKIKQRLL